MAEQLSAKVRQEKLERQFQRIHQFLTSNSKKYYKEYDAINTKLEQLRKELKDKTSKTGLGVDIQALLEIDGRDGVACRLNTITVALARMVNPTLFNQHIKARLPIPDPTYFTLSQIPWEVDAVFFLTNPLLIFDALFDFLKFRAKQSGLAYMYITSRIARLLFRFNKFIMEYDVFVKIVQLTFVRSKRFDPYARQVSSVILSLCQETHENLMADEQPVFLNDLRRFYIMLTRALWIHVTSGQHAGTSLKDMLVNLIAVIPLEEEALRADNIYEDFLQFHFTGPELVEPFLDEYEALQKRDVEFTFEFLGHIHPIDRFFVLNSIYQTSKPYVLSLFAEIRKYYQHHGENLQIHYKNIAQTIQDIVDFQDVQNDPSVPPQLKNDLFFNEELLLDEYSEAMALDEDDLDLAKIKEIPIEESLEQKIIFDAFQASEIDAENKNYVFGLAGLPFCYLTIEFGRSYFNLFTLGDLAILNLPEAEREDVLTYLVGSEQITKEQKQIVQKQFTKVTKLMNKIVSKWKLKRLAPRMYDAQKQLKFYEFKQTIDSFNDLFHIYVPEFLKLFNYKKFLMSTLTEVERWLAHEQKVSIGQIPPEVVAQFIQQNSVESLDNILQNTVTGRQHAREVEIALEDPGAFKNLLMIIYESQQKIRAYERTRFARRSPTVQTTTQTKGAPAPSQETESVPEEGDNSAKFLLIPFLTRDKAFEALNQGELDNYDPYLLELSRTPFRFAFNVFGRVKFMSFTLADTTVMNMEGQERKMIIEFLRITRQLSNSQLALLRKNMVRLAVFMQKMCQKLKREKASGKNPWSDGKQIDFIEFSKGVTKVDTQIQKEMPLLSEHKRAVQVLLDSLTECERWIARKNNQAITELQPQVVLNVLNNPQTLQEVLSDVKETSMGKEHLKDLIVTPKSTKILAQRLIKEYQQNIRLLKYQEKFQR